MSKTHISSFLYIAMKRLLSILLFGSFVFSFFALPSTLVLAECFDMDGDRYYTCENEDDELTPFARGQEEERCDAVNIGEEYDSYEWDLVVAPGVSTTGEEVYPGAIEGPNSDVDYNCDGEITGYLGRRDVDTDLMGMVENVIVLIGKIAVFISVGALVYGGILFATAAGEEEKIGKAKKTMMGAVVGLIVGLIAWNIVGFVTEMFG